MSTALNIRSATPADVTAVTALWEACALVTSYNDPARDFFFALGMANSDVLVGIDADHKMLGSVMIGHDGHRGWAYYVATDPATRQQGIGRQMMTAAENWLRERGIVKLMLLVRETNLHVVDFYTRLGFEDVPRTVMQKWL